VSLQYVPLSDAHVPGVLSFIEQYDEDDAEAASNDFDSGDLSDHWVAEKDGEPVAISGFRRIPATHGSAYLSWTYVDPSITGQGIGRSILNYVLGEAREAGAERIFVKVSNYDDGTDIYAAARHLYQSVGFEHQLTNNDFYDVGEDQLIYALDLVQKKSEQHVVKDEKATIRFDGIFQISETEGAYSFSWHVKKNPMFGARAFTVEDLEIGLDAVKKDGGRIVFLTFPSNLPLIHQPLHGAGFKYVGSLENYFEPGVHEMHFVRKI